MKDKLAQSVLFSGIDEHGLEAVLKASEGYTLQKNGILFLQGDSADRFYIVVSGRIKVYKTSPDGREQTLMIASEGDSFGEAALFAERQYPATAEAMEKTDLLSFQRDRFLNLLRLQPHLAMNMIARLSMLLHHLTRLIQQISLEDVHTRLAGYILDLAEPHQSSGNDGRVKIILSEKKRVLASILGTIPETLSRSLAHLSKEEIITVDGAMITILDPIRLKEIAAGQKK